MLSKEDNQRLTRIGPGTPGGELLRRYWQPVALSRELDAGGAPLPLRLLGENLVAFRDGARRPGLLARQCAHRGTDLSYGRNEDGGLRCVYHGWLYDVDGHCLQQPGEPTGSSFCERIRQPAYALQEAAGAVFAYLGPGEPPLLPRYEFLEADADHSYASKLMHECNYLQGNEGNIDPVHTSFLHRIMEEDPSFSIGLPVIGGTPTQALLGGDLSPKIELDQCDFGFRLFSERVIGEDKRYVRVTSLIFPSAGAFPGVTSGPDYDGYGVNWHVPIDDYTHWKFTFQFSRKAPLDREKLAKAAPELLPDYRGVRNLSNRYLQDRDEMKWRTFAGIGRNFLDHDALAIETMGPIVDRSNEHLGSTDRAVIAYRRMLLEAVNAMEEGRDPPHVVRDPSENSFRDMAGARVVPATVDLKVAWTQTATQAAVAR